MVDHLPECPATEVSMSGHSTPPPDYELTYTVCICDRLRACEQRVLLSKPNIELSAVYGYEAGRADGLSAARDAVAALNPFHMQSLVHDKRYEAVVRSEALAAIDALRGDA